MARDGSGNYTYPWGPVAHGDVISDTDFNTAKADLENALTQSIAVDGQSVVTANIPMAGFKFTNVAAATLGTQYLTAAQAIGQGAIWCGTAGGTANAISLTAPIGIAAYAAGQRFVFVAASDNTAATTLQVGALAATEVQNAGVALVGGEIRAGDILAVTYYNSKWHLEEESPRVAGTSGARNYVLNPRYDVAQWGVVSSVALSSSAWILDQWSFTTGSSLVTFSRETVTPGTAGLPTEQQYFIRSASAAAAHGNWAQPIEDVRTLAGKQVTLTFWAKSTTAGATLTPSLDQYFGSGGSATVTNVLTAATLTTSFVRYSRTVTLPSISGKTIGTGHYLDVKFYITTAAGINVDIAAVQLEEGPRYSVISPRTFTDELKLCQRYWQQSYSNGVAPATVTQVGSEKQVGAIANAFGNINFRLKGQMRTTPTMTLYSTSDGATAKVYHAGSASNKSMDIAGESPDVFSMWSSAAALAAGELYFFHWVANARL